jgi:hypothetical protein
VLEAVLRLARHEQLATPELIAAEAILHPDDVRDAIGQLVDDGFVELLDISSDELGRVIIVAPSSNFATRVRQVPYSRTSGPTSVRKRSSTSPGSA